MDDRGPRQQQPDSEEVMLPPQDSREKTVGETDALEAKFLPAGRGVLMLGTHTDTRGGIAAVIQTYRSCGLFERIRVIHVPTHCDGSLLTKARMYLRATIEVFLLLARGQVALVHAHVSSRGSFWRKSLLLALARQFGIPTIFHLHSSGFPAWCEEPGLVSKLRRRWIARTLRYSDIVIVLTKRWEIWAQKFVVHARIRVVGNPIELPTDKPDSKPRVYKASSGRVLYLGWIYDFKGIYDLLNAWTIFRQRHQDWKLVVGGKGEVERFLAEADRLGITGDLEFLGWISGDEMDHQLRRADILVLPSYNEGMPISLLEGMAYGATLATTPVGGIPDMMQDHIHGLWMKPGDMESIAYTLSALADSPELRENLSKAAYHHVAMNFGSEVCLRKILQIYSELCNISAKKNM